MNPEKAMMCSRDRSYLSHLGEILRTVYLLETLQKLRKGSSRWWQVQTDNYFPVPQCPRGKPDAARCLGIFYPKQFVRQATAELAMKPNYLCRRGRDIFRIGTFVDGFLHFNMRYRFKLERSLSGFGRVVFMQCAVDVTRMRIVTLYEVRVVAIHRTNQVAD